MQPTTRSVSSSLLPSAPLVADPKSVVQGAQAAAETKFPSTFSLLLGSGPKFGGLVLEFGLGLLWPGLGSSGCCGSKGGSCGDIGETWLQAR